MLQSKFSVQDWIDIESILENGIIKLKNNKFIKILKVNPINFNLKSNLEKESILNSYKVFLKTCNFDMQIVIQSNKQDLSKNIKNIEENLKKENKDFLSKIGKKYIEFINKVNSLKTSATKEFYLIIKNSEILENNEELINEELNDKFFKIKECLQRCGNSVKQINNKQEIEEVLFSFLNSRIYLLKNSKLI